MNARRKVARMPAEWFALTICGTRWRIVFGTPAEFAQLAENDGWTESTTSTIWIHAKYLDQPQRCAELAMHEIDHGIGEMSGGRFVVFGDDESKEETAIRVYSPARYAAIAPFLKLPPLPKIAA